MARPVVVLVGRPNVGKSTLFNRLAEERLAVVDEIPGTTRDRLVAQGDWAGYTFDIVDTGGIDPTQVGGKRQGEAAIGRLGGLHRSNSLAGRNCHSRSRRGFVCHGCRAAASRRPTWK